MQVARRRGTARLPGDDRLELDVAGVVAIAREPSAVRKQNFHGAHEALVAQRAERLERGLAIASLSLLNDLYPANAGNARGAALHVFPHVRDVGRDMQAQCDGERGQCRKSNDQPELAFDREVREP